MAANGANFVGNLSGNITSTETNIFGSVTTTAGTNVAGATHYALQLSGLNRFIFGLAGAETGSNNGSNINLFYYNDAGTYLGSAFSVNRATGALNIPGGITPSLSILSNNINDRTSLTLGRTSAEAEFGVAAANGQFAVGSVAGDVIIRNNNVARSIFFGTGTVPYANINNTGLYATNLRCDSKHQETFTYYMISGNVTICTGIPASGCCKLTLSTYWYNKTSGTYLTNYSGCIQFMWGWNGGTNITTLNVSANSANSTIDSITQNVASSIQFHLLPFNGVFNLTVDTQSYGTIVLNLPIIFRCVKIRVDYDVE